MLYLRQGATHKVVIGPAIAIADGFTTVAATSDLLSAADDAVAILHDNATVVDLEGYTCAAITNASGYHLLTLHNDITGTVGQMSIVVTDVSRILPIRADFQVIDTVAYDALFADGATGAFTGVALASGQKVDVDTIKTNPVVNGGTITFPTNATVASTTNITGGTITTTTNLTNLPAITSGWLTATGIASDAFTAAKFAADTTCKSMGSGTCGTVGAATVVLGAGAVGVDSYYDGQIIAITAGTGAGQARIIGSYVGSTKVATLTEAWSATPPATGASTYTLIPMSDVEVGTLNAASVASIAAGVWRDAVAGDFAVTSSIGKCLFIDNVVPGGTNGHFIAGTNAATTITTSLTTHLVGTVDTVTAVTNNVNADVKKINAVTITGSGAGGTPFTVA